MNRVEYMKELEALLSDIPAEEREDAINYYNDYFDAGGEENEESTIISLGTPEELARTIKLASGEGTVIDGEFTETGYYDGLNADKQEVDKYAKVGTTPNNGKEKATKAKMSGGTIALIVILAIFALPILGPIVIALFAVLFGIGIAMVAVVFGIAVAIVAVGVAGLCFGGIGLVVGIGKLFVAPMGALTVIGAALIALAFGLLLVLGCIWIIKVIVPPVCRAAVWLFSKPYHWIVGKINERRASKMMADTTDYSSQNDMTDVISTAADQIVPENKEEE